MREIEYNEDTRAEVSEVRQIAMAHRWAVAAFDPGKHGGVVVRLPNGSIHAETVGDERRGTWESVALLLDNRTVHVLIVEAQYAPRWNPKMHPSAMSGQAASAMKVARNAGLVVGMFAGLTRARYEPVVVYAAPSVWQRWALDLTANAKTDEIKKASIAKANAAIPAIMANIPRAEDRLGVADAWGMLDWWQTSPMR